MKLTNDECITILKQPQDPHLTEAVYHEQRIRLHSEPTLDVPTNPAYSRFLNKVKDRIPDDAYNRFKSLIDFPFVTVDFLEGVFSGFQRVFECSDRHVSFSFTNPDYDGEFKDEIHETEEYFKKNGVNLLKTRFNSYIVIDLPGEQLTERPTPYHYCLPVSRVEQVKVNRKNNCEYIAFDTGDKSGEFRILAFFDSGSFRLFTEKEKGKSYILLSEIPHDLGYCPVAPLWSDTMDETQTMLNKINPATNSLGRLDTLAFKEISKEYSDLYNMYPILATYEEEEDEVSLNNTFTGGEECEDGPVKFNKSNSNNILTNPGRHLIKPIPSETQPDLGSPAEFIGPPVENLEFIKKDLESRRELIHYSIAGKPGEALNSQALNRDQVAAGFESEQAILLKISTNFEEIEEFVLKTKAILTYGESSIKKQSVNYGKNYFLYNASVIMEEMKMAKEVGMPSYIIDQQNRAFINTKYRSNPNQKERMDIIRMLFPYPHLTDTEVLLNKDFLDPLKVVIRMEFYDLLDTFERTYTRVESLMDGTIDIEKKVEMIKNEFIKQINKSNIYEQFRSGTGQATTSPEGVQ